MGIEHSVKEDVVDTKRCPVCLHVSTLRIGDNDPNFYSLFSGPSGQYFACQNPKCNVERIYADNVVMVSGR